MITEASLQEKTSRDLAQMAKKKGVQGWHSMRKPQLVKALIKLAENRIAKTAKSKASKASKASKPLADRQLSEAAATLQKRAKSERVAPRKSAVARKIRQQRAEQEDLRDIAFRQLRQSKRQAPVKDRIVLIVRDAYWLQGYWEVKKSTVERVKVAFGPHWQLARPVLRLLEITSRGNTNSFERISQEIPIHGGVNNWFINVNDTSKSYRLAIGYLLPASGEEGERFYLIAKSNEVLAMSANSETDESWSDITNDAEKYYALSGGYDTTSLSGDLQEVFEEKSNQPMHSVAMQSIPTLSRFGAPLNFKVDAHMVIYGTTDPSASITIAGSPVRVETDGTFALRMELPDKRQVLPVIASSFDGTQQQTTVLAIERNTKVLEPMRCGVNEL